MKKQKHKNAVCGEIFEDSDIISFCPSCVICLVPSTLKSSLHYTLVLELHCKYDETKREIQ